MRFQLPKSWSQYSLRALLLATLFASIVLAGVVYWRTPRLEPDIKARIREDFPANQHDEVRGILLAYDTDWPRMHRCLLHIAAGDLEELKRAADDAQMDYRDVILWAEYENTASGMQRVRAYERPFNEATRTPVPQTL